MSHPILLPVCTFLRVFDTHPLQETLTLPELTAALRRFEIKTATASKIEREIARIGKAADRLERGEPLSGNIMGKLSKAAQRAREGGRDPSAAIRSAAHGLVEDAEKSAKRDLRLWSPTLYRPGASDRGSDNVTHVSCLVLDYDDGTPIPEASTTWSSFFHIVYTTWSHTPDHPRFRLVMPLAFPVPAEDWSKVWSWAESVAHFEIDPAMKSPAATYALPAMRQRDWPREAFSRPGAVLDPVDEGILERRTLLDLEPRRPPPGVASAMRGEDPDKDYVDHVDPEALTFVDGEDWDHELDWEPPRELVAAVTSRRDDATSLPSVLPTSSIDPTPAEAIAEETEGASAEPDALVGPLERLVRLREEGWLTDGELARAKELLLGEAADLEPGDLRRVGPGRHRRTLAIDFDGVIHSYASGWRGPLEIPDPPVDGAIEWLVQASERFDLAITTVRAAHPGAIEAMKAWLRRHGLPERVLERLRFPLHKPPAEVYIDDRGWRFEGTFPSFELLGELEPWTRKKS